jgi:hypothetical protein
VTDVIDIFTKGGENGEYITDYFVQSEDFDKSCIVLGSLADEMSDLSLGFEDIEE